MVHMSRDLRIADTHDLSATVRSHHRGVTGPVVNLSAGGMLITTSSDLQVAETASFELSGPDFHFAGLAEVVHRDGRAMGLHFVSWQGPVERCIRAMVAARLREQQIDSHHRDPWVSLRDGGFSRSRPRSPHQRTVKTSRKGSNRP